MHSGDAFRFRELCTHKSTYEKYELDYIFDSKGYYLVINVKSGKHQHKNRWKLIGGVVCYYVAVDSGKGTLGVWEPWERATSEYETALSKLITE